MRVELWIGAIPLRRKINRAKPKNHDEAQELRIE
jgi:hypothetical protein